MIDTIAFDADDTLWHNEHLFSGTHEKFVELFLHNSQQIDKKLNEVETRNLKLFGYGIKGFMLSMIETAIEITEGRVSASEIQKIIDMGRSMLDAPVEPLPHVRDTLQALFKDYRLIVVTKGDLFDQETKLARSRLGSFFQIVEVVSDKNKEAYAAAFARHNLDPERILMVGNSLKSDILPVLELGMQAVYIPYHTTWEHEKVADDLLHGKVYHQLEHIGMLPELIKSLT